MKPKKPKIKNPLLMTIACMALFLSAVSIASFMSLADDDSLAGPDISPQVEIKSSGSPDGFQSISGGGSGPGDTTYTPTTVDISGGGGGGETLADMMLINNQIEADKLAAFRRTKIYLDEMQIRINKLFLTISYNNSSN